MTPQHHRMLNMVLAVLAVGMLAALALVLLLGTRKQPASDLGQAGNPTPTQCGRPAVAYAGGKPFNEGTARDVAGVHAAACAGDYDALIPFVSDRPPSYSRTAVDIVEDWRREDPAGIKLQAAAVVLEQPGVGGQGGLAFCQPDKGLIVFSRGTIDIPPKLGDVEFPRADRPVDCSRYALDSPWAG